MNIRLEKITEKNWHQAISLKTGDDHKMHVASNLYSIAESHYTPGVDSYGIYDGKIMVGFAMFGQDEEDKEENGVSLWRFMIGNNHRCKGYGKAAMKLIIETVKEMNVDSLALSTDPSNHKAIALYTGVGFQSTGEFSEGEEIFITYFNGKSVEKKVEDTPAPKIIDLPLNKLEKFCGSYFDKGNDLFRGIYLKGDELFYSRGDDPHSPLQPIAEDKLIMNMSSANVLEFKFYDNSRSFKFYSSGELISDFSGYQLTNLPDDEMDNLIGSFRCDHLDATYTIEKDDDDLLLKIGSKEVSKLSPTTDGEVLVEEWESFFSFTRDSENNVTTLKSDEKRAEGLIFTRVEG